MAIFLYIVGGALIFIGVLFHLGLALSTNWSIHGTKCRSWAIG